MIKINNLPFVKKKKNIYIYIYIYIHIYLEQALIELGGWKLIVDRLRSKLQDAISHPKHMVGPIRSDFPGGKWRTFLI